MRFHSQKNSPDLLRDLNHSTYEDRKIDNIVDVFFNKDTETEQSLLINFRLIPTENYPM